MEASQAQAEAAEGAQTGAEGQQGEQGQEAQESNPLVERFDQFEQGFGERMDALEERFPEADGDKQDDGLERDDGPKYYEYPDRPGEIFDEQGRPVDPAELDAQEQQRAFQQLQQQLQQQTQEQLAPVLEYFEDRQAADLEAKYPKLQDGKYADQVLTAAEERAAQFGNPELAKNAGFLEMVHLQLEGHERAAQETPAGAPEQGAHLETDGVSRPATSEEDPGDRIVGVSARRNSFFD